MMTKAIRYVYLLGPLVFAIGFLTPLFSQLITASDWTPPFGLSPLEAGFFGALVLGIPAQLRGRWI
ncbi:hypothetical protein [Henriciella litoralis]|uniref:hypothetical protein n=1 Tax=Henriciella litoralis TaxID=568102 RepID=UPI000A046427|nr:hypothetical protein [Henriciella litoralis]